MRLDVFLCSARLVLRRGRGRELCERGAVMLNGVAAKPSKEVRVGDRILIAFWDRRLEVEVVSLPSPPVARRDARLLYRVVEETTISPI